LQAGAGCRPINDRPYTASDLAFIFLDSIGCSCTDHVGGISYEEMWQALVRMTVIEPQGGGDVANDRGMGGRHVAPSSSKVWQERHAPFRHTLTPPPHPPPSKNLLANEKGLGRAGTVRSVARLFNAH
jgi:hypothetical protein